jgi:hypothetical protein
MLPSDPTRTSAARGARLPLLAAAIVVGAVLVGALGRHSLVAWSWAGAASIAPEPPRHRPDDVLRGAHHGAAGEADGVVPDGATAFDDELPAVARLDHRLLGALRRAATDAARDRVEVHVNSGWRSARYQEQLLQRAISRYGSEQEAARWVATPETSAHVSGDAVDVGPAEATAWLSEHGARYGLCQIYDDEPWHYELRPDAVHHGCPPRYADPTHDPRTQR